MPTIADVGFAVAHETRVLALELLMSGRILPNGEIARACRVPASTMSEHLAVLLKAGLVRAVRSGRNRYYAIASERAASLIEAAGLLAQPDRVRNLRDAECSKLETEARMCYDHLAGRLGVGLMRSLIAGRALELRGDVAIVTTAGAPILEKLASKPVSQGSALPCCVDYSERAFHLRGSVAVAIASTFLKHNWVRRGPRRSLIVTAQGLSVLDELVTRAQSA